MNLKTVMLNERSKTKRPIYCVLLFILYSRKGKVQWQKPDQKWPGAWGQGRELSTKPDSKQKSLCWLAQWQLVKNHSAQSQQTLWSIAKEITLWGHLPEYSSGQLGFLSPHRMLISVSLSTFLIFKRANLHITKWMRTQKAWHLSTEIARSKLKFQRASLPGRPSCCHVPSLDLCKAPEQSWRSDSSLNHLRILLEYFCYSFKRNYKALFSSFLKSFLFQGVFLLGIYKGIAKEYKKTLSFIWLKM